MPKQQARFSTRDMPRGRHHAELRQYLNQRVGDLLLLSLDAKCDPFGDKAELVIAVDWSEVYAYIFGLPAPDGDPLVPALGSQIANAAHQIALITLFENFSGKVILLPPYAREMTHFIAKVRTEASADAAKVVEEAGFAVYNSLVKTEQLKAVTDLASEVKVTGDDETSYQRFLERLRQTDRQVVLKWVSQRYAPFLLYARFMGMDVLQSLTYLLGPQEDGEPGLRMLADLFPDMARTFVERPVEIEPWTAALRKVSSDKPQGSRLRDAQALAYLDRLVPMMHEAGKQLLFLTRSNDMIEVMNAHVGRFACLTDHYYAAGEARRSEAGVNPPTIARGWRGFFELGMALGRSQGKLDETAAKQVAQDVDALLADASAKRNGVAAGNVSGRALDRVATDLASAIQNQRALISTKRPRIPKASAGEWRDKSAAWRVADYAELAVKFFIRYVTDPVQYKSEREEIREKVLQSVNAAQRAVPGMPEDDPWHYPHSPCRSVARELIVNLGAAPLLVGLNDAQIRELLEGVYDDVQHGKSDKITTASKALRDFDAEHVVHERAPIDLARLETSLALARGWPDQLSFLLTRHEPLLKKLPGICQVLWRLMKADAATIINTPVIANGNLRRYAEYGYKETGIADSHDAATCLTAIMEGWLRYHLDWVEESNERLENFPLAGDRDRFELEVILEHAIETHHRFAHTLRAEKLLRSLHNDIIYAAARVVPSVGIEGLLADQLVTLDEARVADRQVKALVTENLWDNRVLNLVDEMERWSNRTPDEADTLAYYYLKHAYWLEKKPTWFMSKVSPGGAHPGNPKIFDHLCGAAAALFEFAATSEVPRSKHLVTQHSKLLTYMQKVVQGPTGVFQ